MLQYTQWRSPEATTLEYLEPELGLKLKLNFGTRRSPGQEIIGLPLELTPCPSFPLRAVTYLHI
eukprot:14721975-Heterocapsa_arctica.AAC.1